MRFALVSERPAQQNRETLERSLRAKRCPMKKVFRRLRGIIGAGAIWGTAGAVLGSIVALVSSWATGVPFLASLSVWGLGMGFAGVVLGAAFGTVLTLAEGRRRLADLTPRRAAAWGATAGAVFPVGWVLFSLGQPWTTIPMAEAVLLTLASAAAYGTVGGLLAGTTVWIARRAPGALEAGGGEASGQHLSEGAESQGGGPENPASAAL